MLELNTTQRKFLRAAAHSLKPVAMIGSAGLTPSVLAEIERGLIAHELIKVRILNDDRSQREAWMQEICTALECEAVQHIGKLLLLFKPADPARMRLP